MITLWPHQIAAADRIRRNEISALWWDMRVGKTLATIAGTDDGDRLIICPNSVKAVWKEDLLKYDQESFIWDKNKKPSERPRNLIINYESLWRTNLLTYNFDSIIFDESLRLQNIRTKLWKHIYSHIQYICKAKRVVLLSGTPCPEGEHQLIPQSIVATGQYCGITDPWEALRTYFVYDDDSYSWDASPGHRKTAAKQLHDLGPVLTQKEAGINTKKLYRTIEVELEEHEINLWATLDKKELQPVTLALYAQSIASGRSIAGHTEKSTKLDAVVEYVSDLSDPCVILVRFTESLRYLHNKIKDRVTACIDGSDAGPEYRAKILGMFSRGEISCLICNVATVQVGLNLSAANTLIFAENSFSGATRIQAEERSTIMNKVAVEVVDFVSVGPPYIGEIDRGVLEAVRHKKDFNAKIKGVFMAESSYELYPEDKSEAELKWDREHADDVMDESGEGVFSDHFCDRCGLAFEYDYAENDKKCVCAITDKINDPLEIV